VVTGGKGEPARKDQGARADLTGGDVKVGVDRRGVERRQPEAAAIALDYGGGVLEC
jgi:hypothetical protein